MIDIMIHVFLNIFIDNLHLLFLLRYDAQAITLFVYCICNTHAVGD